MGTKQLNKKVVSNAAYMATIGTVIFIGFSVLPNLVYEEVAANTGQQVFELSRSAALVWIAVFSGETGYTLVWLNKVTKPSLKKAKATVKAKTVIAKQDLMTTIEECLSNGKSLGSTIICAEGINR